MSATKVLTATKLPSSGQKNRFYIDKSTSKVWIWDDNFIQIGTFGDNETITLNAAGNLCLKNWNLEYYKWVENPPHYEKQTAGPWPTNLELRSTANGIAWFQTPTTIEDIYQTIGDKTTPNTILGELANKLDLTGGTMTGPLVLDDGSKAASETTIAALKLPETYEAKGSAAAVQTALLGDAAEAYNTLGKLEDAVIAAQASADEKTTMAAVEAKNYATKTEAQGYATAVVGAAADTADKDTVKGAKAYAKGLNDATNTRVEALETAIGEGGSVGSQIDAKIANLDVAEVAVGTGEIIEKISETDGKISVSKRALVAGDIPTIEQSQVNGLAGALAAKQDTLAFQNDNYDKTTNKAITKSDLDAAVAGLSGAVHFIGVKESLPASGNNGDICIVGNKEYVYSTSDSKWHELGDETIYAVKGQIKDVDIAADAAIAQSKIAGLTDALNAKANSADLGTMAAETAADYIKKTEAPGYADILTATVAGTTYETKADASAKLTEAKTHTTTELGKLTLAEVAAGEGQIISKISQANGKVSAETRALVAADIPTIEQNQVNGLGTALAAKANDADLAAIAKDGNVNSLVQTEGDVLILYAGTAFDVDTSTYNAEEVSY